MNTVDKDVPSRIVNMNMFVTIAHIVQQPVTLTILPESSHSTLRDTPVTEIIVLMTYVVSFCAIEDSIN